jgi:invasion protein IalB
MSFHVKRLGAAALALSLALGAGAASAQTTPPKPAAPAAPAAPAPAAPAAPGQPTAGAPPQPPSKVDLVSPEPQWVKLCGKEPTTGKDACQVERAFGPSADQPPVVSIQVFELQGEERRKLRLMLPVGTLLKPGFRVIIDKGDPIEGKYELCAPNACIAEIDIGAATLAAIKKGQTMSLLVRVPAPGEPSGRELTLNAPIKDFAAAYEGKATDPKLLEQQRQQLQQQLQKKAEEQRKLLEQQQQQSGAAAPGAAAPAPAPAAPAPAPAPKQ